MGPRILLVTRRFWPLGAPEEAKLLELAGAWREQGAKVSVVTPQWDRSWPTRLVVREMEVTRLAYAAKRLWGGYWYLRRLKRWMLLAAGKFDAIVVWRLQLDAIVALRVGRDLRIPVALLYEGCGELGDAAWLRQSPYGSRVLQACRGAAAILSFCDASLDEALRLGFDPAICHVVKEIFPSIESANHARSASRLHLLESNRDFFTTASTPVGLTIAPLENREALTQLFLAWSKLRDVHHDARLWWIGDGAKRSALYSMLGEYELRYHAVLPGDFDDFEDIFAAPNFYVANSARAAALIGRAMAAGLGVIASDAPDVRAMTPRDAPLRYFHAPDVEELTSRLREACDAPEATSKWGDESRAWVWAHTNSTEAIQKHLAILSGLAGIAR
jgi:glycosyltransferase involved in cell wall biosynthesis